jgi:hypothetical protein
MYARSPFELFASSTFPGLASEFASQHTDPPTPSFSNAAALLLSNSHLIENTGLMPFSNSIIFNQLRIARTYISRNSFAHIILRIGYRGCGYGPSEVTLNQRVLSCQKRTRAQKKRRPVPGNQPPRCNSLRGAAYVRDQQQLFVNVDADVEAAVIPIGFVIATPLAVLIHAGYVVLDRGTVVAMAGGVVVDAGFIGVEFIGAIRAVIVSRAGGGADGEHQSAGERGGEENSGKEFGAFHYQILPGHRGPTEFRIPTYDIFDSIASSIVTEKTKEANPTGSASFELLPNDIATRRD